MKKVLIIAAVIGFGFLVFGNKKEENTNDPASENPNDLIAQIGFNLDGTPRQLTDDEVLGYLANNQDIADAYGKDLKKAKDHWFNHGYLENRKIL